jgi:hypothetical protein
MSESLNISMNRWVRHGGRTTITIVMVDSPRWPLLALVLNRRWSDECNNLIPLRLAGSRHKDKVLPSPQEIRARLKSDSKRRELIVNIVNQYEEISELDVTARTVYQSHEFAKDRCQNVLFRKKERKTQMTIDAE